MTRSRSSDSGRERDGGVVAMLKDDLLVPFDDEVAAGHVEAMLLEFDWELAPDRGTDPVGPRVRRSKARVRAAVGSLAVAATMSLTSGFAAAGALPSTAQHWLSRATRVVGIDLPDAQSAPHVPAPSPVSTDGRRPARATPSASGARPTAPVHVLPKAGTTSAAATKRTVRANGSHPASAPPAGEHGNAAESSAKNADAAKSHAGGNGNGNGNSSGDDKQDPAAPDKKVTKSQNKAAKDLDGGAKRNGKSDVVKQHGRKTD